MAHYDAATYCPSCGFEQMEMNPDTKHKEKKVKPWKADGGLKMSQSVTECLGRALDNGHYSDFTVRVGSQSFKCHKLILGACSEFFAALLRSDMQEKATGTATAEGMTADTFRLILDAIYKGQSILTVNNMLDVWQGAHQLQIDFLIKASEDFIVEQISINNYLDVYQVANLLESDNVKHAVHTLMINKFSKVIRSKTFPDLPPDCLLALVSSNTLKVPKDVAVKAILAWTRGQSFGQRDEAGGESFGQFSRGRRDFVEGPIRSKDEENWDDRQTGGEYERHGERFGGRRDFAEPTMYAKGKNPWTVNEPRAKSYANVGYNSGRFPGGYKQSEFQPGAKANPYYTSTRHETHESKEIPPEHKWRQGHLVRLLEAVNLIEISNDCVSVLMSEQIVLASVEALRMVSQIAAKRLSGQQQDHVYFPEQNYDEVEDSD